MSNIHRLGCNGRNKEENRISAARIGRLLFCLIYLLSIMGALPTNAEAATSITFTAEELLGKPTDSSITINIVPASTIEYHYQYGTESGSYTWQTNTVTATGGKPHEVVISGLTADTRYYYRMRYHIPGETDWVARSEHTFHTQRAPGEEFIFTVTSDTHANFNASTRNAMTNILNEDPDFLIDLGDTFMSGNASNQNSVNNSYLAFRDPLYMDHIGHSVPIFLASGNHEDEEGWNLDDTPFSPAVGSIQARKAFFPTPIDDGFYSGNTDTLSSIDESTYGDEYREDYYAWEWGDALFVVIDEFQYTMSNPYGTTAGEGADDPITGDQWNWTLGEQQYNWLKETLEGSNAKYKFVFSHNMLGGIPRSISVNPAGYVRGGAEAAAYFEWGGKNADGTWGFNTKRPGWETPIHQLFVDNGVSAYFHGHDHQYVYETRDGVVYQEVPSPGMSGSGFSGIYTVGTYSDYNTIKILPNSGHLRIIVTENSATVDYVSSSSTTGTINYTYTIFPHVTVPTHILTTAVDPAESGTINPEAGDHTYNEGELVSITAFPNRGYFFSGWSGACTGSSSCSVTMNEDKTVTANFSLLPSYRLTTSVNPTGGGSVDPAVGSHTFYQGEIVSITASPSAGYIFSSWDGDCSGTGSCSVTMNSDKSVIANFIEAPHVLGDVNGDGKSDSTDALIILSGDVGIDISQFCPINCGDVNEDGFVNSTDALIILSYDVGMTVPFPIETPSCPSDVTPCQGCNP